MKPQEFAKTSFVPPLPAFPNLIYHLVLLALLTSRESPRDDSDFDNSEPELSASDEESDDGIDTLDLANSTAAAWDTTRYSA